MRNEHNKYEKFFYRARLKYMKAKPLISSAKWSLCMTLI